MYRIILSILMILLLISCKVNNSTKGSKAESFRTFREKFYSDTSFQRERILFPLPGINTDDMEIDDSIYFWGKDKWRFLSDFSLLDDIKKETIKSDSSFFEKMFYPESGFIVNTEFRLINDKWFLSRLEISNL